MKLYRVTVSLNISSVHKIVYAVAARSVTEAVTATVWWDHVRVERIR